MYRKVRGRGTLFLLLATMIFGAWSCGGDTTAPEDPTSARVIPALRFAGVDFIYALRRIAAEANMLLALDEIQPRDMGPDLDRFRIDLDLEAGPVRATLEQLKAQTGAFEFMLSDNVIYVRSQLSLAQTTGFDTKDLPETKFKGNIEDLVRWIMANRPSTFLKAKLVRGEPIFRVVEIEVAKNSSVLDLLLTYTKKANRGWRVRRAGQATRDPQGRLAVIANSVALWGPLDEPNVLPRSRMEDSIVAALASVSERTKTPICITDVSPLGNFRGWLDYGHKVDPQMDARESVGTLAWSGGNTAADHYAWETLDGIIRVYSQLYKRRLSGQDLLHDTVKGGTFEGTLPELARWLNRNRSKPAKMVLMGGEITGEGRRTRLDVPKGATIEEVLVDFAKSSGECWNWVSVEAAGDSPPTNSSVHAWQGAYLAPLARWR